MQRKKTREQKKLGGEKKGGRFLGKMKLRLSKGDVKYSLGRGGSLEGGGGLWDR